MPVHGLDRIGRGFLGAAARAQLAVNLESRPDFRDRSEESRAKLRAGIPCIRPESGFSPI